MLFGWGNNENGIFLVMSVSRNTLKAHKLAIVSKISFRILNFNTSHNIWILLSISIYSGNIKPISALFSLLYDNFHDCTFQSVLSRLYDWTRCVYTGTDQRKYQSSASLAFVRGNHRWLVNSPYKGPVTRKMFPFDNVFIIFFLI